MSGATPSRRPGGPVVVAVGVAMVVGVATATIARGPQRASPEGAAVEPRRIAITIDDLPVQQSALHTLEEQRRITEGLLATLDRHRVRAVGFVNESKLEAGGSVDPERVALLEAWLDAGQELGNHGYAHLDLHRVEPERWMEDVLRGERVIRPLAEGRGGRVRWFRHPYLHVGLSAAVQERTMEFLAEHGYRVAPVTVDNGEWLYARAYAPAWQRGGRKSRGNRQPLENRQLQENRESRDNRRSGDRLERLGRDYVRYMQEVVAFYEEQAEAIVGRAIPHVLLIHANALNADWLDELLERLGARGYGWIELDEALEDPAYDRPIDGYTGEGGITWLHRWAITRGADPSVFRGEPEVPEWVRSGGEGGE